VKDDHLAKKKAVIQNLKRQEVSWSEKVKNRDLRGVPGAMAGVGAVMGAGAGVGAAAGAASRGIMIVPSLLTAVRVPFKHSQAKKSMNFPLISLGPITTEATKLKWVVFSFSHACKKSKTINVSRQTVSQRAVGLTSHFKMAAAHFSYITAHHSSDRWSLCFDRPTHGDDRETCV
jgi:hypothetical protein